MQASKQTSDRSPSPLSLPLHQRNKNETVYTLQTQTHTHTRTSLPNMLSRYGQKRRQQQQSSASASADTPSPGVTVPGATPTAVPPVSSSTTTASLASKTNNLIDSDHAAVVVTDPPPTRSSHEPTSDIVVSPSSTLSSKKKKKKKTLFSLFGGGSRKSSAPKKKGPAGQTSKPDHQKAVADGPTMALMVETKAGGGRFGGKRRSKLLPPNIPNLIRDTSSMSIGSGSEGSRSMSMLSHPSAAVSSSSLGGWSSSLTSRGSTLKSGGSSFMSASTSTSNTMSTAMSIMSKRGPVIASSESQHERVQAELGLQESDLLYILKETIPKFYKKQQQVELQLEQSSNSNTYGDFDFDDTAVGCGSSQGTGGFFTSTMEFHINDKEMEREMVLERSQWHAMNIAMKRGRKNAGGNNSSGRHQYGANSNTVRPEHWPRDELDDLENILQTFLDASMVPSSTSLARADSGGSHSNNGSNHISTAGAFSGDASLTPLALAQVHTTLGLLRQATGGPGQSIDNLRKALWIHQRSTVTGPAPGTAGNSNSIHHSPTTTTAAAADSSQSQRLLEVGKACHRLAMSYARLIRPITMMVAPPPIRKQSAIPGIGGTLAATRSTSGGSDHGRGGDANYDEQQQQQPDEALSSCKSLLQAAIENYENAGLTLKQSSLLLVVACATLQHYIDEERRGLERLEAERVSRRMQSLTGSRQTWSSLPSLPILTIDEQNSHGSSSQSGPLFAGRPSTASQSTGTERP